MDAIKNKIIDLLRKSGMHEDAVIQKIDCFRKGVRRVMNVPKIKYYIAGGCIGIVILLWIGSCRNGQQDQEVSNQINDVMKNANKMVQEVARQQTEEYARLLKEKDLRDEARRLLIEKERMESERKRQEAAAQAELLHREKIAAEKALREKEFAKIEAKRRAEKIKRDKEALEYKLDISARGAEILHGIDIWGSSLRYKTAKKVVLKDFLIRYYGIYNSVFFSLTNCASCVARNVDIIEKSSVLTDLGKKVDHLLYYCSEIGIPLNSTPAEKELYLSHLRRAALLKKTSEKINEYVRVKHSQLDTDGKWKESSKNAEWKEICHLLDSCMNFKCFVDAEERAPKYETIHYPAVHIPCEVSSDRNSDSFINRIIRGKMIYTEEGRRECEEESNERHWNKIPIDDIFPVKAICGLEFGQTRQEVERNLGSSIGHWFNGKLGMHVYNLKKPFRFFKKAILKYGYSSAMKCMQGLYEVNLVAEFPEDVGFDNCVKELLEVKKIVEEKYGITMKEVEPENNEYEKRTEKGVWYGTGIFDGMGLLLASGNTESPRGCVSIEMYQQILVEWNNLTSSKDKKTTGKHIMVLKVLYMGEEIEKICDYFERKVDLDRLRNAGKKGKELISSDGVDAL